MDLPNQDTEKSKLRKLLKRRLKAAKKYVIKCETEVNKALSWAHEHHLAELLSSHLYLIKQGMTSIQLQDWVNPGKSITIPLDSTVKPSDEVAKRFRKAKKLKLSQEPLKKQYKQAKETFESCLLQLEELEITESLDIFKQKYNLILQSPPSKRKLVQALPYYEFFSASSLPIWVGRNAKGNDAMTFHYANGNDYWLHIADYPGSHVVIHSKEFDEETLQDALQLAMFYSKGKELGKAEVNVTQKKHVSRLGNQPGKVQISKHKTFFIALDIERIQKIKNRKPYSSFSSLNR